MSGTLNMSNNLVSSVKQPESEYDAMTTKYVDNEVKPFRVFRRRVMSVLENFLGEKQRGDVKIEIPKSIEQEYVEKLIFA